MIKEKNPLLKIKLIKTKSSLFIFFSSYIESFYTLFDLILENPIENFWFECLNLLLGYFQLIAYIFDPTVSKSINSNYLIIYSFGQFGIKILLYKNYF